MKKKNIGRGIIMAAFIMIICMSKIIWLVVDGFFDQSNYEKREMAEKPSLTISHYSTFSKDYTAYFNDNLQFRNLLIMLNSEMDYYLFERASNKKVIIGKDDWLFFDDSESGDPIASYMGDDLYSEDELEQIAHNCVMQRDFLAEQGKDFVILIAPNKERIYYEYMPDRYGKPADQYRALQVVDYLKEHTDIRVVYPYADLMDAKGKVKDNIYYKTDTHWNYIGAYVGASALLKELGIEMPGIDSEEITISKVGETSGDLAGLLNLSKQLLPNDSEYTVEGYNEHDLECTESEYYEMWSFHATGADPRSIYVLRDSFTLHMAEYIGSQFNNSYLRYRESYTYDDLVKCDPDIVVFETVERAVGALEVFRVKK